jgi:hypothetical protein
MLWAGVVLADEPLTNVLVRVPLSANQKVTALKIGAHTVRCEVVPGSIVGTSPFEALVVLPSAKASEKLTAQASAPSDDRVLIPLEWKPGADHTTDLVRMGQTALRYVHPKLDESSADARLKSFKPYHHVFLNGVQLTNGPEGKFPHHRGFYFGFMKCTYDGKTADTWHCRDGVFQSHEQVVHQVAGPFGARQCVKIDWHGKDKAVFATEQREVTFVPFDNGLLIDFVAVVAPTVAKLKFDGDPQHAGFHFRAAQEVEAKTSKQTYFLRPDGPGKPGETRNYDPKSKKGPINLPWNAMSFVIGTQRYTTVYLDHPANPKEARGSERDYGRFGTYFEHEATKDAPLKVQYRLWVQPGELDVARCTALATAFVQPPTVTFAE